MDSGCILRVAILATRAQVARRYFLEVNVGPPADAAGGQGAYGALRAARTDVAGCSCTPSWKDSTFHLHLPAPPLADAAAAAAAGAVPVLTVSLFAKPSLDAPAGPVLAGKELDELVGRHRLPLTGPLAARLQHGERVTLPAQLQSLEPERPAANRALASSYVAASQGLGGQAALLQASGKSQRSSSPSGTASWQDVVLELQLLQREQLLAPQAAAGAPGAPQTTTTLSTAASAAAAVPTAQGDVIRPPSPEPKEATLQVVVSAGQCWPLVPGPGSTLVAPSTYVALKSLADVEDQQPAQAQTQVCPQTQHPTWGELLTVCFDEEDLDQEQLLLAVVQAGSNKLLLKATLPLAPLVPEQLYHLQLQLSNEAVLFVSCRLLASEAYQLGKLQRLRNPGLLPQGAAGAGAAAATAAVQEAAGPQGSMVQLQLRDCQPTVQALSVAAQQALAATERAAAPNKKPSFGGRAAPAAAAAAAATTSSSELWLACACVPSSPSSPGDAAAAAAAAADVLQGKALHSGCAVDPAAAAASLQAQAQRFLGPNALQCLPLCSSSGVLGFPWDSKVLLPCPSFDTPFGIQLHLYRVTYYPPPDAAPATSKGGGAPTVAHRGGAVVAHLGSLQLPQAEIAATAAAAAASGRPAAVSRQQLVLAAPATAAGPAIPATSISCEVLAWRWGRYLQALQAAVDGEKAEARANLQQQQQQQQQQAQLLERRHGPQQGPSSQPWSTSTIPATAAAETLLGDLLQKQALVQQQARQLADAAAHQDLHVQYVQKLQQKNQVLAAELEQVQQQLTAEREAAHAELAPLGSGTTPLTHEQLLLRMQKAEALLGREKRRNGELAARLQELHAERLDVLALQKEYKELQEAHYQQSKLLNDLDGNPRQVRAWKAALQQQEGVITNLEKLLAAAVARSKDLEELGPELDDVRQQLFNAQQEAASLRLQLRDLTDQDSSSAAAALSGEAAAKALLEVKEQALEQGAAALAEKETERLAAVMRSDKAEAALVAAQNELLDVTKRYAREIAALKARLAEKDAQLMGGFGALGGVGVPLPDLRGGDPLDGSPGAMSPALLPALLGRSGDPFAMPHTSPYLNSNPFDLRTATVPAGNAAHPLLGTAFTPSQSPLPQRLLGRLPTPKAAAVPSSSGRAGGATVGRGSDSDVAGAARAGSAEARVMVQGLGRPASALAGAAAPRVSVSADGPKAAGPAAAAAAAAAGAPLAPSGSLRRGSKGNDGGGASAAGWPGISAGAPPQALPAAAAGAGGAAGGGSAAAKGPPPQQQPSAAAAGAATPQRSAAGQRAAGGAAAAAHDDEEDEFEDEDEEEEEEEEEEVPVPQKGARVSAATAQQQRPQQQQQQQQQQQPAGKTAGRGWGWGKK